MFKRAKHVRFTSVDNLPVWHMHCPTRLIQDYLVYQMACDVSSHLNSTQCYCAISPSQGLATSLAILMRLQVDEV
jgi:hypothetical protein